MKLAIRKLESRPGAKHSKFRREKINILKKIVDYYLPIFAAPSMSLRTCLASLRCRSGHALREIFRVSVLALPRQNTHHGYTPHKLPTAWDTTL